MFISLLVATFAVALFVSVIISSLFAGSIKRILDRIIQEDLSGGWLRYIRFAILVVGVASGVRLYALERYILPQGGENAPSIPELNLDRWVLEIYRTVIETAAGVAWMLLVFFVFALVAYVITRGMEMKHSK